MLFQFELRTVEIWYARFADAGKTFDVELGAGMKPRPAVCAKYTERPPDE